MLAIAWSLRKNVLIIRESYECFVKVCQARVHGQTDHIS